MGKKVIFGAVAILFVMFIAGTAGFMQVKKVSTEETFPVRILVDPGHGGKYLRQKNKKDLCGRTGLKKYANKPKIKYIHKLNDSVSLAILFDLRIICPKSGTCTDKLWIIIS